MSTKYKCIVRIINRTSVVLNRMKLPNDHGIYTSFPSETIPPNGMTEFVLEMENGKKDGAYGSCTYGTNGNSLLFTYHCPYHSDTKSSKANVEIESGEAFKVQMIPNPVPWEAEPLQVQFTVSLNPV